MESRCSLAQEVGLCNSRELRWFFNVTSNKCEAFNYTGCRGNGNRFNSMTECNETCEPHRCEPVRCRMFCPFGWAKDESGCEICKCVNPCEDVRCSDGEHCLPERRQCDKSPCPVVGKCFAKRPDMESRCSLAQEVGLCNSRELKWFFNVTSNKCEAFNYTGCRGNGNRFNSMTECNETCEPHRCEPVRCRMFCPFGWAKDESGCEICKCVNPCEDVRCSDGEHCLPERRQCDKSPCPVVGKCFAKRPDVESRCSLAQEVGLCNSRELKWFFNVTSNKCEAFNYTGCRGNGNRFDSKTECNQTCAPHHCEPVRCRMFCPFGWAKDENGCEICECVNPCEDVSCNENERCLPERNLCNKSPCPVVGKCFPKRPDLEPSCSLALEVGLCNSRELKWFFNVTSNKCQAFNYTGCRGNGNRFDSKEACGLTCTASGCTKVRCLMFCPFGFVKDDNGCDICRCINPCRGVSCPDGKRCFPERRSCNTSAPCPVTAKCIAVRTDIPALCSVPSDFGLCANRTTRWYFDTEADQCKEFIYGGCRGNMNNFESQSRCGAVCQPSLCQPLSCDGQCEFGWDRDINGCRVCRCRDPCKDIRCSNGMICDGKQAKCVRLRTIPADCRLPRKPGMCRAYFPRWFYNATEGACQRFVYGGCQANANNFKTKTKCEDNCLPSPCPDMSHCGMCEHGMKKDVRGCDICECSDNPCASKPCDDNMRCEVMSGNCSGPGCQTVARCVPHNATECPPVCARFCEYGFDKAPDGCPICHCHDPCKTVNCGQGFTCKVKRCSRGNPECQPIGICVPKSATSTESPERLRVKPGLCPENEQMGMGICAEMCAYDMSCPGAKKCCSNGCGHVCTDPVTVPPPMNTTTTAAPANVTSKPQLCPDGSSARNCTGVCERASCEETTTTSASRCIADPCNKCRFVFQDFSHRNICSGWLCPATNESRLCDAQNMCGSNPTCQWMPDANCVDDHCNCRATFVDEFNLPMDCDTELTTCQRMQTHAQARSKVVSDLWVPDCDGYGRFKAQQQNWGFSWCVDPLGHRLENTNVRGPSQADCSLRNITSVIGSLRLDADYETTMNDKTKFMEYMEPQIADMMMVPEEQVAIFKVEAGSVVIYFNVRADRSDQVSLLSKAGRFERLVRAGKLRLVYEGRPLNVVDGGKSFRFGFVYADEPSSDASAADMSRGVIIAITIVACAGLLGVLLVSMVCVSWCKRRKVYEVEEKTIPAFENPRYMSTDELKEKL
ncbi:Papilin [Lamellibrachia satsuma]|nr:Papilin [Lamellibrachia satsuma]